MTVSNAQGEYEQLERERVEEDMRLAGQAMGKRELEDGAEEGPAGKKAKIGGSGAEEDDEDMEMEMDDEDDADGEYCYSWSKWMESARDTRGRR